MRLAKCLVSEIQQSFNYMKREKTHSVVQTKEKYLLAVTAKYPNKINFFFYHIDCNCLHLSDILIC